MRTQPRSASGVLGILCVLVLGSLIGLSGTLVAREDLPSLKPGMWKFTRTMNGRTVDTSKCTNPTEDMNRQNARLEKSGCTFAPIKKSGSTYTMESTCAVKLPTGGSVTSRTTTVMTIESDSAYRLEVTGTVDGQPTKESLAARWVGACQK